MKSKLLLFCTLFMLFLSSSAQSNLDSLWQDWEDISLPDSTRAKAMTRFIHLGYVFTQPDSAIYFSDLLIDFSVKHEVHLSAMKGWSLKGMSMFFKGEAKKAEEYYNNALEIALKLHFKEGEREIYNNLGALYGASGNFEKALENFTKALVVGEEIHDTLGIASALGNIGLVYKEQGNLKKATYYYQESLRNSLIVGDDESISTTIANIGGLYESQDDFAKALEYTKMGYQMDLRNNNKPNLVTSLINQGNLNSKLKKYDESLRLLHEAFQMAESMNNKEGMGRALELTGSTYMNLDSIESAYTAFTSAMALYEEIGDSVQLSLVYGNLGKIAQKKGDLMLSIKLANTAMKFAEKAGYVESIQGIAELLYEDYKLAKQPEKALEMYELFITLKDSLQNDENRKDIIRLELGYEFDKEQLLKKQEEAKQTQILAEKTTRRNRLQYSVILILLLAVIGGVVAIGFIRVSAGLADGLIFFAFLIFFEFLLVLADPWIDNITGGAPGWKLLANATIALLIFPIHHYSEHFLKRRLVRNRS